MGFINIIKGNKLKISAAFITVVFLLILIFMRSLHVAPITWNGYGPIDNHSGVALKGFDPVIYYPSKQAQKGLNSLVLNWKNVMWQFKSADNKSKFEADPEKYAPQFGGYCAFAVSVGFTAAANPESWVIENDKLYMFADDGAKQSWVAQWDKNIILISESNWSKRGL